MTFLNCPHCHIRLPGTAKFCSECGQPTNFASLSQPPRVFARDPGIVAQLDAWSSDAAQVVVPNGSSAAFFAGETLLTILDAGQHRREFDNNSAAGRVLLFDDGELELEVQMTDLPTGDGAVIGMYLDIVLQIANPLDVAKNLVGAKESVCKQDLVERFSKVLKQPIVELLAQSPAASLATNRQIRDRLEMELSAQLNPMCERWGMELVGLAVTEFHDLPADELADQRAALMQDQAQLDLAEVQNTVNARDRELANADRADAIRTKAERDVMETQIQREVSAEVEEAVRNLDHAAALKELERREELAQAEQTAAEQRQDHQALRRHQQRLKTLRAKRIQLAELEKLHEEKLRAEGKLGAMQRQNKIAASSEMLDAKLDMDGRVHQHELRKGSENFDESLRQQKAQADLERDQEEREAELAMKMHAQLQANKSKSADDAVTRELKRSQGEHQMQLEKMDKFNTLSSEALIASASPEQAKLLASLKETEALKGLTEEQILARAAGQSPEVAAAFAEKFKAAGGQEAAAQMERFYERMQARDDQATERLQTVQSENAKMLERLLENSMNTRRDVDVEQAKATQPAISSSTPTVPEVVTCPKCAVESRSGSKFCGKCGFRLQ